MYNIVSILWRLHLFRCNSFPVMIRMGVAEAVKKDLCTFLSSHCYMALRLPLVLSGRKAMGQKMRRSEGPWRGWCCGDGLYEPWGFTRQLSSSAAAQTPGLSGRGLAEWYEVAETEVDGFASCTFIFPKATLFSLTETSLTYLCRAAVFFFFDHIPCEPCNMQCRLKPLYRLFL